MAEATSVTSAQSTEKIGTVPLYAGLGKACKDVLEKDYVYSKIKVDIHSKTATGFDITGGLAYLHEEDKFAAYLGAKYPYNSLSFGVKGNADNIGKSYTLEDNCITVDAAVKDEVLRASADCSVNPKSGHLIGNIKAEFQDQASSCNIYSHLEENGPMVIDGAVVLQYKGILAGYQLSFDTDSHVLKKNNLGFQYTYKDCTFHACADNEKDFMATMYYKSTEYFEGALQAKWSSENNETYAAMGGKFDLDEKTSIKLRMDSLFGIGFGFRQKCSYGITVLLSALLDCQNFGSSGKHKFGAGVQIEI